MTRVKSILAILILLLTIIGFSLLQSTTDTEITENVSASENIESEMVDEVVYPHDQVIDVNIQIDESDYEDLLANAMDEEAYVCDITYNGYTLTNVAIRTKGNSSLRDVFTSGDDRFSFNIDLNYYLDQDLFGIDKIILNNLFNDPTMMAEYLTYEAFDSLDAVSSRTSYTALYINDEYYGLYLSVESVSNEFLETNYGDSLGELYKPEQGVGSDLDYVTSDGDYYTGLINKNTDDDSNEAIVQLLEAIDSGENIDEIFNVDSFLKYLAISTYTIHLDTYQSGMFHNYYLYNDDGVFQWIPWDLNMTFNGFPGVNMTDQQATEFLIDEPVVGSVSDYPLVETILSNDEYLDQYHEYLQELTDNYFDEDSFEQRVLEVYDLINGYVKTDTNSFYSYTEFTNSLFTESNTSYSLLQFVEARNENIDQQLSGEIPSTNNGLGNTTSSGNMPTTGQGDRPGGLPGNDNIPNVTIDEPVDTLNTTTETKIDSSSILTIIGGSILMIVSIGYMKKKIN